MPPHTATPLTGLDPAGLMRGALGGASGSWPQDGPVEWSPPEEAGSLFPGYDEVQFLGRGGMGAVYAARQISLDRRVALKLLPPELSRNPAAAERFRREARALAKLSHPHIVAVHDFGETPDGAFFFVMEHVEGSDLHRLIRDARPGVPQSVQMIGQICEALDHAHAQGFVHRDIKPANILVDTTGRVKVSDFGLARLTGENPDAPREPAPTMTGGIVGTPDYIAPEQRAGHPAVDHRADIYSLGVMLCEMLTGSVPRGAFEPPSRRADVPPEMDRVVLRAMQEDPAKRYQRAAELKAAAHRAARPPARRRWLPVAAVVLIPALGAMLWEWNAPPSPPPPAPPAAPSVVINSLGMKLLPFGPAGLLMAEHETMRKDYAVFAAASAPAEPGLVYFPGDGTWQAGQGTWLNPPGLTAQSETHAVVAVSADDAAAFCTWLTERERDGGRIAPGHTYRLPRAEEWAQAAGAPLVVHVANSTPYAAAAAAAAAGTAGLTGQSRPSPAGFYDLAGNVVEWTSSPGANDSEQLACGTGWGDPPWRPPLPAMARPYARDTRGTVLGFRILLDRTAPPSAAQR